MSVSCAIQSYAVIPIGRSVAVVVWCVCVAATVVSAQVASGEITGVIRDQAGMPTPGVNVTITASLTNQPTTAISNGDGLYTVAALAPGDYVIDVAVPGFRAIRREGVRLRTGEK